MSSSFDVAEANLLSKSGVWFTIIMTADLVLLFERSRRVSALSAFLCVSSFQLSDQQARLGGSLSCYYMY